MTSYSQNKEDLIVLDYFKGKKGTVLEIGANDGITFSNSLLLIERGWGGILVEPSPEAFHRLALLHSDNDNVILFNDAIHTECCTMKFYDSANHVPNGQDRALVSTMHESERDKWMNVDYKKIEVSALTFQVFLQTLDTNLSFDFISIDAEGSDWDILQQINLKEVGCKCLCIEYNSKPILHGLYTNYVKRFGFKEIHINAENVIFAI